MDNVILRKTWTQGSAVVVDDLRETAFTGENGAHTFIVSGQTAKKQAVPITGTITGAFLAPNNTTVPLTGEIVDDAAVLTLPEACYAVPGRFILSIYAANDGVTMCIYCGVGYVFRTNSERIVYPTEALPSIADLIADAQEIASSVTADADRAEAAATSAAASATSAASSASAAAESAASIPEFLVDTLFDWYMDEHSGQVTPFTKIASATITGTNLKSEIVFDPDTTHYSGGATISGTTAMYSISNIVLANPDAKIGMVSYQKVSGSGTLEVGKRENTATILFTLSGSELIGRLRVPIQYVRNGKTYSTTYQLTITVTKSA